MRTIRIVVHIVLLWIIGIGVFGGVALYLDIVKNVQLPVIYWWLGWLSLLPAYVHLLFCARRIEEVKG